MSPLCQQIGVLFTKKMNAVLNAFSAKFVFQQRLAPLTIPSSVSSKSPNQQQPVPSSLLLSAPGSRQGSRAASPNFLPKRMVGAGPGGGEGKCWERQDLELHCAHLESEIDRLENDSDMYRAQVDELNFKVEQVSNQ